MERILELPVGELYTRDVSVRGFAISNASVDDLAAAAHAMNHLMSEGRLRGVSLFRRIFREMYTWGARVALGYVPQAIISPPRIHFTMCLL